MSKNLKSSEAGAVVYQLKVRLVDSPVRIWRRVQVENSITLERLHRVLQVVMGWTDDHLHGFSLPPPGRAGRTRHYLPVESDDEKRTRLAEVLRQPNDSFLYEYDFGDGWEHEITLQKVLSPSPTERYPVVVDGRGACPPEDVGGVSGYSHFLEVINDPQHPEHEEMLDWCGPDFDPSVFDVKGVNHAILGRRAARRPDA